MCRLKDVKVSCQTQRLFHSVHILHYFQKQLLSIHVKIPIVKSRTIAQHYVTCKYHIPYHNHRHHHYV